MVKVYESSVIDAPISKVWDLVKSFEGLGNWAPGFHSVRLTKGADLQLGCERVIHVSADQFLTERLVAISEYSCTYKILEQGLWKESPFPFPLYNYTATFTLRPLTDGDRTFIEWHSEFESDAEGSKVFAEKILGGPGLYQSCFARAKKILASKA